MRTPSVNTLRRGRAYFVGRLEVYFQVADDPPESQRGQRFGYPSPASCILIMCQLRRDRLRAFSRLLPRRASALWTIHFIVRSETSSTCGFFSNRMYSPCGISCPSWNRFELVLRLSRPHGCRARIRSPAGSLTRSYSARRATSLATGTQGRLALWDGILNRIRRIGN
jgi:hypothetical protein